MFELDKAKFELDKAKAEVEDALESHSTTERFQEAWATFASAAANLSQLQRRASQEAWAAYASALNIAHPQGGTMGFYEETTNEHRAKKAEMDRLDQLTQQFMSNDDWSGHTNGEFREVLEKLTISNVLPNANSAQEKEIAEEYSNQIDYVLFCMEMEIVYRITVTAACPLLR